MDLGHYLKVWTQVNLNLSRDVTWAKEKKFMTCLRCLRTYSSLDVGEEMIMLKKPKF